MTAKKRKFVRVIVVIAVVGVIVTAAAFKLASAGAGGMEDASTFVVEKGDLTISINESGTIKSRDLEIIKSQLEGISTVLWVIDEATHVKKGDVLVELDASGLEDIKIDQQTLVQDTDTLAITAREALAVGKNQAQADIDLAQLTLDFAILDLEKYTGDKGEYETAKTEAEAGVKLSEEELEKVKEELKWSKTLAAEKYISSTELKIAELAYSKANLNVKLASNKLRLLKDFTYKRQLAQLNSDVSQAEMGLERTKRSSAASVIQLKAQFLAAESKFEREKIKLAKIEDQIKKAIVIAPADGMVVYASSAKGSWRGNQEPLEEGQSVHEREELIYLPTSDSVKAEIKVHESSMEKVKEGLPVIVTVDAVPGKTFTGKVAKIALLPDAQSMWMNPDLKIYKTEIYLDGDGKGLRTGMSCRAEIIVEHYDDVMFIPIQAVVRIGKQQTVYVREGKKFNERKVEIGMDNNRMVHIKSGLEPGEVVLLTPPLAPAELVRPAMEMENLFGPDGPRGRSQPPAGPGSGRPTGMGAPGGAGRSRGPGGAEGTGSPRPPQGSGRRRPGSERPSGSRPPRDPSGGN